MTETFSTVGPECPYCHTTICADSAIYYNGAAYTDDTCISCGKRFAVTVEHTTSWTCEEIDDS